jgi:hypothetical protein
MMEEEDGSAVGQLPPSHHPKSARACFFGDSHKVARPLRARGPRPCFSPDAWFLAPFTNAARTTCAPAPQSLGCAVVSVPRTKITPGAVSRTAARSPAANSQQPTAAPAPAPAPEPEPRTTHHTALHFVPAPLTTSPSTTSTNTPTN